MRWRPTIVAVVMSVAMLQMSSAPKPVELLHVRQYIFDRDQIVFDTRLIPNEKARLLRVAAMNEIGYAERSSDEPLEGEGSRKVFRIEWLPLSAGHYSLIARIYDEAGARCARTAEYWGSCKALASATSNLEVRGFSAVYSPVADPP